MYSKTKTQANKRSNVSGQHSFAQIPSANIPRSALNRSCGVKTTFDSGDLVPIFVDEALPGDTMTLNLSTFARMATPLHPIMDNLHLDVFFFAVPNRLLWENWERFMGEQDNPGDSVDFEIPQILSPVGGFLHGSLEDYFGMPVGVAALSVSALWNRAYNLIWAEWFRSQDLQDSPVINTDDGPDSITDYPIRKRGKRHDYFTSCLPFPQKGNAVTLPLGSQAPLVGNALMTRTEFSPQFPTWTGQNTGDPTNTAARTTQTIPGVEKREWTLDNAESDEVIGWGTQTGLRADLTVGAEGGPTPYADLSTATAANVNTIRQAFQLQKLYERDARGGTRYTEIIRSHFGVVSPDARLQRPEYLGGAHAPITMYPVPQTSETGTSPQGNLGAFVTSSHVGSGFTKSFTEHCIIIGLACVRADLNYQQGLNRMFSRKTRNDFYWPAFAGLGEQSVLNDEIYAQGTPEDKETFGYQERFAEYRYKPSIITHRMRSQNPLSLDTWHLAQDFASLPLLNDEFIQENPPVSRVIAVPSEPEFLFDAWFTYKCVRPMPTYGIPGLVDHF